MTNGPLHTRAPFDIRASDFFRHLSFVIRHSDNRFMVSIVRMTIGVAFALIILAEGASAQPAAKADQPQVTAPPQAFFELVSERDRELLDELDRLIKEKKRELRRKAE